MHNKVRSVPVNARLTVTKVVFEFCRNNYKDDSCEINSNKSCF